MYIVYIISCYAMRWDEYLHNFLKWVINVQVILIAPPLPSVFFCFFLGGRNFGGSNNLTSEVDSLCVSAASKGSISDSLCVSAVCVAGRSGLMIFLVSGRLLGTEFLYWHFEFISVSTFGHRLQRVFRVFFLDIVLAPISLIGLQH